MTGLFPSLNKFIPLIIFSELLFKSIFSLFKSSSKFAFFLIKDNFELKSSIFGTSNKLNIKSNLFPFELPPKPALSDLYQLGKGGSGGEQPQLPSFGAVGEFVNKVEEIAQTQGEKGLREVIPLPKAPLPFIKPSIGEPDLLFNKDNVDTVGDILRDMQGNIIDKNGNLIKKE